MREQAGFGLARRSALSSLMMVACVLGLGGGCDGWQRAAPCAPALLEGEGFVEVRGGQFWIEGQGRVRFAGTNYYPALETVQRGDLEAVEAIFDDFVARGVSVVRIWAFNTDPDSSEVIHAAPGQIRESGLRALDEVLAAASARKLRLVLTLSNHWGDYGGVDAYASWAGVTSRGDALRSPRVRQWFGEYIEAVASRTNTVTGVAYRDDPTILGWDLMNEPRCPDCEPALLVDFLVEMAQILRRHDLNHLVGTGDEGFEGLHGADIGLLAASGAFDWVSVHLWPHHSEPLSDASGSADWSESRAVVKGRAMMARAAQLAARQGVPLLVGEAGWPADAGTPLERSMILAAWQQEALDVGAGGFLVWMLGPSTRPDYDGYLVRQGDEMDAFCGLSAAMSMP